jgi:hypothetical protein
MQTGVGRKCHVFVICHQPWICILYATALTIHECPQGWMVFCNGGETFQAQHSIVDGPKQFCCLKASVR